MLLLCLCTLAGAYSLEFFPQLPPAGFLCVIAVAGTVCCARRRLRPVGAFLLGFLIMGISAWIQLADRLDPALVGQKIPLSARIASFPVRDGNSIHFIVHPVDEPSLPARIRLGWYDTDAAPMIGETWRLNVRLKRPRGYANPGGFDFEAWLYRQRIGATGYVDDIAPSYRIFGAPTPFIAATRARFVTRLANVLPPDAASGVLMAIGAGARHHIDAEHWDLYARTGTSHLMAISGLHIGLAAGSAYLVCWGMLAAIGFRQNFRDFSLYAAIVAATAYAALSGYAVPTQRALIMACVTAGALRFRRRVPVIPLLSIPCLFIFVADPSAILTPGFKLSFAAVAILIGMSRQFVSPFAIPGWTLLARPVTAISQLTRLQFGLLAGLFPFTVLIFGRFALVAPLANLLVLPIFNLLTVPLTLGGGLLGGPFAPCGDILLQCAHRSIEWVLQYLTALDNLPYTSVRTTHLSFAMYFVLCLPLLYVFLPNGWPGRKLAPLAMAASLTYEPPNPPAGCLDYQILDVGQGLAVYLRTQNQALLFDTGPAFRSGGSAAELVVLPFLQGQGIDRLDALIVSHGDLDHAGGVASIIAAMPIGRLLVGEALPAVEIPQIPCIAGIRWQQDDARYAVLHPRFGAPWTRNNASCVLEVSIGEHRLLLTGDIESPVEKLLDYRHAFQRSHIVVVPHHGSRTSSTAALIEPTRPDIAVVAASFGNQWGLPKEDVVARWEAAGTTLINTAIAGAVGQRLCAGKPAGPLRRARLDSRKYWREAP